MYAGILTSFPPTSAPRSADDLLDRLRKILADLHHSPALEKGDVAVAVAQLTEAAASALGVERASVWKFNDDRSGLECMDLFKATPREHSAGVVLRAADTPAYFRALAEERTIAAHEARSDPRTSEFTDAYLVPNGITSMLDAPIFVSGKLFGVVCNEHVGSARDWDPWEELVAGTFADFVALALGEARRVRQERQLERLVEERTAQLEQSKRAFEQLFQGAPVGLVLTRLSDHSVLSANPRASEMFGLSARDAQGQHAPDYWESNEDRDRLVAVVREHGRADDFEARLKPRTGEPFWANIAVRLLEVEGEQALLFGIRDVTAHKALEEKLRTLATTDELTGALNRRRLFEVAEEERLRAARYHRPLCFGMLDLDHFKKVNDDYGHAAGDEALARVATMLKKSLRRHDHVGRYGGEELLVVFTETGIMDAAAVAERIRRSIQTMSLEYEAHSFTVTISAGIVEWVEGEDLGSVVRRADAAMYEAKAGGRNRVVRG
jgi:diguanylate cyclase (GGDEF)-like protein/PAS domain S-box-containing protein